MDTYHCEPPLSLMLEDPLTQALMESDGVDPRMLDALISEARDRIAAAGRKPLSGLRGRR